MGRGEHYRAVLADESTDDHEAAKNRNTENKSAMETRPKEERIKKKYNPFGEIHLVFRQILANANSQTTTIEPV